MSQLKEILDNASIETDSKKKPIAVKYQQPETMEVDIDVPNIRGNRTPVDYMKYLTMQGGFDWSMWRKPYVVEVSAAAGREWVDSLPADKQSHFEKGFVAIEDYGMVFRVMFDGGHRRELHKLAFPGAKTWKCDIYKVETVKEAHIQFVKIQSELQRKLHADLLFVQSYYGGDSRVQKLVDLLKYTGLVVQYEDDVVGEESLSDFSKPAISINGFKKIKVFDKDSIKLGVDLMKKTFKVDNESTQRCRINQYLLYAMAGVLDRCKVLGLSTTERAELVQSTLDIWAKKWDNFSPKTQLQQLEGVHAKVWGSDQVSLSPDSGKTAFQSLVNDTLIDFQADGKFAYSDYDLDPEADRIASLQEKRNKRAKRLKAKMKVVA